MDTIPQTAVAKAPSIVRRPPPGLKPIPQRTDSTVSTTSTSSQLSTASAFVGAEHSAVPNKDSSPTSIYNDSSIAVNALTTRRQSAPNPTTNVRKTSHQDPPALPAGWVEMKDPSGRTMFYNMTTNENTWERPQPEPRALPSGWEERKT